MEKDMDPNTKLEVALEILDAKIGQAFKQKENNKEEYEKLLQERKKLYKGDKEILNKIIDVYGPEIKKIYEGE